MLPRSAKRFLFSPYNKFETWVCSALLGETKIEINVAPGHSPMEAAFIEVPVKNKDGLYIGTANIPIILRSAGKVD